jgi:putative zinc finger protein
VTADAHARFQVGLSAHLAGVLPPEETAWMETHAGECADCRSLLGRGQAVFERLGASGVHIPARMLSSFLLEPNDLTPLERELVGRHLESCAECRQDMEEMARAAGVPPRLKAPGASGGGWGGVGAVLAAAAVVAAIVVWRQARHPPPAPPAPPIAAIPAPTPEAALGGAPLLVLQERVRGATRPAPASDTIGFGQRVVRIQLPALFVQRDSRLLITATTAAGVEVARDTLPTEALDRPFELTATLGPWSAGDYVLKVIPAAGRDTTATRVFEFKLLLSP